MCHLFKLLTYFLRHDKQSGDQGVRNNGPVRGKDPTYKQKNIYQIGSQFSYLFVNISIIILLLLLLSNLFRQFTRSSWKKWYKTRKTWTRRSRASETMWTSAARPPSRLPRRHSRCAGKCWSLARSRRCLRRDPRTLSRSTRRYRASPGTRSSTRGGSREVSVVLSYHF